MSNNKSAIKKHTQSEKRKLRNISKKSTMKTLLKKINLNILNNNKEIVKNSFLKIQSFVDNQANKGLIHRNKSSRIKSKLMKKINKM